MQMYFLAGFYFLLPNEVLSYFFPSAIFASELPAIILLLLATAVVYTLNRRLSNQWHLNLGLFKPRSSGSWRDALVRIFVADHQWYQPFSMRSGGSICTHHWSVSDTGFNSFVIQFNSCCFIIHLLFNASLGCVGEQPQRCLPSQTRASWLNCCRLNANTANFAVQRHSSASCYAH